LLGKVIGLDIENHEVIIKLDKKSKLKLNQQVNVSPKQQIRTLKQNSFYWCLLTWVIHPAGADLQHRGWFSTDGLHICIKEFFKSEHGHDFELDEEGNFTTTLLTKERYQLFLDILGQEFFLETVGVDIGPFWKQYEKFGRWQQFTQDESFRRFMDEDFSLGQQVFYREGAKL
jgi:hypothetical protein